MDPLGFRASKALVILLDDWSTYKPGDVVSGRVARAQEFAERDVMIEIALKARCKASIRHRHLRRNYDPNNDPIRQKYTYDNYSSCFELFKSGDNTVVLHTGILNIPKGSNTRLWPFTMPLPTNANPAAVMQGHDQQRSYLEFNEFDIANCPLPDSFTKTIHGEPNDVWTHVEYYLEAKIMAVVPLYRVIDLATAPILMKNPVLYKLQSRDDFGLRRSDTMVSFRSYDLEQDAADRKLSFAEKRRSFFRSSKLPELIFLVQYACPSVIQAGNTIPFNIRILPRQDSAPSILQNTSIKYSLAKFHIKLTSETDVICASSDPRGFRITADSEYPFAHSSMLPPDGDPILIPVGKESEGLDIGTSLQLRFSEQAAMRGDHVMMNWPRRLYPSFVTYNTRLSYRLTWKMTVQIEGTKFKHELHGTQKVTIIGAESSSVDQYTQSLSPQKSQERYRRLIVLDGTRFDGDKLVKQLIEKS